MKTRILGILILIFFLTGIDVRTVLAMSRPEYISIESMTELITWHDGQAGSVSIATLTQDLLVDSEIRISESAAWKELGVIKCLIKITNGGVLILEDSNFALSGPNTVIVVESGGTLVLNQGHISTAPDADAIIIHQGGSLIRNEDFHMDGGKILDENEPPPPNTTLPPLVPPSEPPEPTSMPITKVTYPTDDIVCLEGNLPESPNFPSQIYVTYLDEKGLYKSLELPVQWQLVDIDLKKSGTYIIRGTFSNETLDQYNLSNPEHITAELRIIVLKRQPVSEFAAAVISIDAKGQCTIRMSCPLLPDGVSAIYLYESHDGKDWSKVTRTVGNNPDQSYTNFYEGIAASGGKHYFVYKYKTDYQPIWLKIDVVGSACEGISNIVKLEMPKDSAPGTSVKPEDTESDGSFDGNRGGTGADESSDRDINASTPEMSEKDTSSPDISSPDTSGQNNAASDNLPPDDSSSTALALGHNTPKSAESIGSTPPKSVTEDNVTKWEKDITASESEDSLSKEAPTQTTFVTASPTAHTDVQDNTSVSRGVGLTAAATIAIAALIIIINRIYVYRKRKA